MEEITTTIFKTNENYSYSSNKNINIKNIYDDYKLISKKINLIIQKLSKTNSSNNS